MKKTFFIILALLISATLFANEKYSESKYFFTYTNLKVRSSSNLSAKVITVLDEETCVELVKKGPADEIDYKYDYWVKIRSIRTKGKEQKTVEGWVFGGYLLPAKEEPVLSDKDGICLMTRFDGYYGGNSATIYTYYYKDKTSCVKLFTYVTEASGPNYDTEAAAYFQVTKGKKYLYLGFRMADDGPYGVKLYKIDITNAEKSNLKVSYGRVKGNKEFIEKNVKTCIFYEGFYVGDSEYDKYERYTPQSYRIYKKPDFNSEIVTTVSEKGEIFLYFGYFNGEKTDIYFEDGKDGAWVQCKIADDENDYWVWVE